MKQKTNWMLCLSIGIGISLLMITSCEEKINFISYNYIVDHVYTNHTGQHLTMKVYNRHDEMFKSFNIQKGHSISTHTWSGDVAPALFHFESFTHKIGDSVIVKFDDAKCITYLDQITNNKIFNLEEYDNYNPELIKPGKLFTLYYTFTEEDYNLAVDCQ